MVHNVIIFYTTVCNPILNFGAFYQAPSHQATKPPSHQATMPASKQASKQASTTGVERARANPPYSLLPSPKPQASKQASKPASQQASKPASPGPRAQGPSKVVRAAGWYTTVHDWTQPYNLNFLAPHRVCCQQASKQASKPASQQASKPRAQGPGIQ